MHRPTQSLNLQLHNACLSTTNCKHNGITPFSALSLLHDVLIDRGGIEKRDLIQAPFTVIHSSDIRGIFQPAEINEILELANSLVA